MGKTDTVVMDMRADRRAGRGTAVILMAELRNYPAAADMLPPANALEVLETFHAAGTRAVEDAGGSVLERRSDALLAAFFRTGALHDAQQAVRAAQRLQIAASELAGGWRETFGVNLAAAMSLHLGDTVVGDIGPANDRRLGAAGEVMQLAARLARRARAGEFVLSDAMMGALTLAHLELDTQPLPPLDLGRGITMAIHGVLLDTRLDFT